VQVRNSTSVELTDAWLHLKVLTPQVALEVASGDVSQPGAVVSNSEVGLRVEDYDRAQLSRKPSGTG